MVGLTSKSVESMLYDVVEAFIIFLELKPPGVSWVLVFPLGPFLNGVGVSVILSS
jgi:hypothetical protein